MAICQLGCGYDLTARAKRKIHFLSDSPVRGRGEIGRLGYYNKAGLISTRHKISCNSGLFRTIMAPPGSAHLNFSVGGLVAVGGIVGFAKKGSKASLLAGVTFGGLLIGSGIMISGESQYQGHALATATSGIMTIAMGQRFLSTGKFMPAGLVATLGAACCAYNLNKAIEWAPSKDGK